MAKKYIVWYHGSFMKKSLTVATHPKKKQLQKSIDQKKKILALWTEKLEVLRMELDLIQHEYNVRIGYLLLKDNQLDLEIIQLRNLKKLIDEGMTYAEAIRHEEDMFYNEILRMQEEAKKINEEKEMLENRNEVTEEEDQQIKSLWKSLIRKFHPDLVQNIEEKREREKIMKLINQAYAALDFEALQQIALTNIHVSVKEATVEVLEQELIEIENAIVMAQNEWDLLKVSEWFLWKKKIENAKKTGADVFAQLEKNLLDDIVKKISIRQNLQEAIDGYQSL